ncbi:MAG: efflux RND transporter periplasmic adaptor subunit [Planctomycetota bacterium]
MPPEPEAHSDPTPPPAESRPASPTPSRPGLVLVIRLAVAAVMLGVAGAVFLGLRATAPTVEAVDPEADRRAVSAFEVRAVPVRRQWRGYGTAEALDSAEVPARVSATVASIPEDVLPGRAVTRGQLLVQLDASDFDRQLEIAEQRIAELDAQLAQLDVERDRLGESLVLEEADVSLAQADFDRQRSLRERNVNNQQDLDAAQRILINAKRARLQTRQALDLIGPRRQSLEAQRASQRSQVNLAELNRQRTTIVSPIDGVIQSIDVEVGENVMAGQQVAFVVSLTRIEVPIALRGAAQSSVRVGDAVTLRSTSLPRGLAAVPRWSSTVDRVSPQQDPTTRTLTVYAELAASAPGAPVPPPGMFLEATVSVAEAEPRLLLPQRAVRGGRVQVVEGGQLVGRSVAALFNLSGPRPELGLPDDQWVAVEGDLAEGDTIVLNAASQLADGTAVDPRLPGRPATAAKAGPDAEAAPKRATP